VRKIEVEIDGKTSAYNDSGDKSILEFLESKGVEVHAECRGGYCGACRCKLVEGDVEIGDNAIGFVNDDEILTCSTKAKGNIKIRM